MSTAPNVPHVFDPISRWALVREVLPDSLQHPAVSSLIQLGLAEDLSAAADLTEIGSNLADGDLTSMATLLPDVHLAGRITAKASGVVAGLPLAEAVFKFVEPQVGFQPQVLDGERVNSGQLLAVVEGHGQALLAAERTAINFLGRLSGVATLTRKFVDTVVSTGAVILDTRKTLPGSRLLDKYAVRMGGGQNHRLGLYDMVLVKDNHIDGAGGIEAAVARVREQYGHRYPVEVEVKTLDELDQALALEPTRIMLDNMDMETMRQAVTRTNRLVPLEASGNVSLKTVRAIAETGVDYISVGALTHSAPVLDISMRLV